MWRIRCFKYRSTCLLWSVQSRRAQIMLWNWKNTRSFLGLEKSDFRFICDTKKLIVLIAQTIFRALLKDDWFCNTCLYWKKKRSKDPLVDPDSKPIKCVLCDRKGGAMKGMRFLQIIDKVSNVLIDKSPPESKIDFFNRFNEARRIKISKTLNPECYPEKDQWAHMVCALFIEEVSFNDSQTSSGIIINQIPARKKVSATRKCTCCIKEGYVVDCQCETPGCNKKEMWSYFYALKLLLYLNIWKFIFFCLLEPGFRTVCLVKGAETAFIFTI